MELSSDLGTIPHVIIYALNYRNKRAHKLTKSLYRIPAVKLRYSRLIGLIISSKSSKSLLAERSIHISKNQRGLDTVKWAISF